MSFPQDGRDMDQRPGAAGSVRRARERVQAGYQTSDSSPARPLAATMGDRPQMPQPSVPRRPVAGPTAGQPRAPRPQAPPGLQTKDGQLGATISRPTQVPQWPLPGPLTSPQSSTDTEPYQPPPGKSQPPQRPPRPSRVPSMLDGSKIQDHTPVFQYRPQSGGESSQPQPAREPSGQELLSVPETPSSLSRPSTISSVGSIPDFPLPIPLAPPRRSVNLGPPPSARRGASSFYSNASYVSPIPEESPRSRSHTSFASSAAMPENWGEPSPGPSPNYPDASFEDIMADETGGSADDDEEEESQLVRSASLGKRGKPTLVTTATLRGVESEGESGRRPAPTPIQNDPFKDGTGYLEASSSSSGALPTVRAPPPAAVTTGSMLDAYSAASAADPSNPPRPMPSPQPRSGRPYNRLSAIWGPPRPEADGTTRADSRASLTSLPDLIRRATRLAASLEGGRRPASRFDDLNDSSGPDPFGRYGDKESSVDGEKHQSGFSDMLAAFPPPAQPQGRRSFRESLRLNIPSWPLPLNGNRGQGHNSQEELPNTANSQAKGRRVCGLPFWRFVIVVVVILILVAAAIVIPLELLVLRRRSEPDRPALEQCQAQLTCENGGTNVVKQDVCSCICTGGFTGSSCTIAGATGCTTTSLAGDTNIDNVTLGDAIPRLIQQAQPNFSVSLSPTTILAKLNAGNLSCSAENALVTFGGQSAPLGDSSSEATDSSGAVNALNAVDDGMEIETVTVTVVAGSTVTLKRAVAQPSLHDLPRVSAVAQPPFEKIKLRGQPGGFTTIVSAPAKFSTIFATTISFGDSLTTSTTTTTTTIGATSGSGPALAPAPAPTAEPGTGFTVAEKTLDFARVVVLFVLQETTLDAAESAQVTLQRFFADAGGARGNGGGGVDIDSARNVTLGDGNSVDLVNLVVHTASGARGGRGTASARKRAGRIPLYASKLGEEV